MVAFSQRLASKTLEDLYNLSDSMILLPSTDLPLFLYLHLQLVSMTEDIWAGVLSQCMNYVCLHYINHDFSAPHYFLTVTCSNIHFLLTIIAQYRETALDPKGVLLYSEKHQICKTPENKSQRATDLDTKASVSANRIWKNPSGDYWLIQHKHQLVASGSPHDFEGDKLSNYCKLNKLQLNVLLK